MPLTLVLGGAASGKSDFAETLVQPAGGDRIYVATAQVFDDEMRAKVQNHRRARGPGWHTVEAPFSLGPALEVARAQDAVLIDCATMWLTNHVLRADPLPPAESALMQALARCPAPVVVVSNEVGAGIVPDNALARRFREAQGRLNQTLAAQAERVVTVMAGLPLWLKGAP